jgi:hypothetical protein
VAPPDSVGNGARRDFAHAVGIGEGAVAHPTMFLTQ